MKVRILTSLAGADFSFRAGELVDQADTTANLAAFVASGAAELVDKGPAPETATAEPDAETATVAKPRRRRVRT